MDDAPVTKVLNSWGPGRFGAELDTDGRVFRTNGTQAAVIDYDNEFLTLALGGQEKRDLAEYLKSL